MKKLGELKLNNLGKELSKEKMRSAKGGTACVCCCLYANSGGSSTYHNGHANCLKPAYSPDCDWTGVSC